MMSTLRSNSASAQDPQAVTLWFDEEKNKHYLINNDTGTMKEVMKTGDYIRRFDVRCTGSKSYKERLEFSQNNVEYAPHVPKSLKFDPTKSYYAPLSDKYDGYAQFRCPRGNPWDNQVMVKDKKRNPETIRRWIEYGKTSLKPSSPRNQSVWDKKREFHNHLTAPLNQYETLKVQNNQTLAQELKKKNRLAPNLNVLEKTMTKIRDKEAEERRQKVRTDIIKEQNKPVNINDTRYSSKVKNWENKTVQFPENFRQTQTFLRTYVDTKDNESLNLTDLARNIDKYRTTTFNKQITFRKTPFNSTSDAKLKTETDFMSRLNREKQEMKGFVREPVKEKNSVLTEGRFGTVLDTEGARYLNDRKLMKTINPELYVVKENKSAKMRRAALTFQKGGADKTMADA